MFTRETAPNVLSPEQEQILHEQAMRILQEIGTDVLHEGAKDLLKRNGQDVDGDRVRWDEAFVEEMVARAPSSFRVLGRNPERSITIGEGAQVWANVGGPPFASDLDEGRRSGRIQDHDALVKLTQATDVLACVQSGAVEAVDLPHWTRHLDMDYSVLRFSDKPYTCYGTSGPKARDAIAMAAIVHGGRDAIERTPVTMGVVNSNSPLVWDFRMADALIAWAEANQPIIVTPFLLAGATAPVSVAGGLAQQVAETLSGVALAQAVRPGVPCLYGSFFTATDMRTGSPAFGTPESVVAVLAGAQLARRYGLPFRGGGALASSNAPDAQAMSEALMMMWATVLAGTDFVLHAAGWLEGGLTASFEKFALDLEILAWLRRIMERGIGFSEEELAFDALAELGPGGLFLESSHTMTHFRDWLSMSPVFTTPDHGSWEAQGSPTADVRANARWKKLLESYEDPGLDEAVDEELRAYIDKRKAEPPEDEE
ncbi:MAG TPA: trimethylamine methyltransferase family protein [Actinomycetota bacterium]|nr:trimethylamine methyltransferase family protein [Actinomycetota bacterium]